MDTIAAFTGTGTGRNQINALTLTTNSETLFKTTTDSGTAVNAVLILPTNSTTDAFGKPLLAGAGAPLEFNQNSAISSAAFGRKVAVGTEAPNYSVKTFDSGRPFRVRISGQASFGASAAGNTLVVNLYAGATPTLAGTSKLTAMTAVGASTTSVNFCLETYLQWDSVGQLIGGYYTAIGSNGILTAPATLTNNTGIPTAAGLVFTASAVFAAGSSNCTVNVAEFSCEQV
jgi:hypothetical protein